MRAAILRLQTVCNSVIVEGTFKVRVLRLMRIMFRYLSIAVVGGGLALAAVGQADMPAPNAIPTRAADGTQAAARAQAPIPVQTTDQRGDQALPMAVPVPSAIPASMSTNAVRELMAFSDADVKFDMRELMEILRDRRHEGWVLAAYPDPKTGQPLIGAGFSLDLPARPHLQLDAFNPHPFIEPSSAELWQAAGLEPARLNDLLNQFDNRLAAWSKNGFRKRIKTLSPQITDEDANLLLRVGVIQAVYNAKGYCREFDRLTASQQMALTQLVYQMGVNLQEFSQFLSLINDSAFYRAAGEPLATDAGYWRTVQQSLVESQWARLYRARATAVIAMLDPQYPDAPRVAEQRVGAMLHPAVEHRRPGRRRATARQVSAHSNPRNRSRGAKTQRKTKARQQKKRGV